LKATEHIPGKPANVSAQWAPFFTSMLLSPGIYRWAKSFIASEAWAIFNCGLKTTSIKVPDSSPSKPFLCLEAATSEPDHGHSSILALDKSEVALRETDLSSPSAMASKISEQTPTRKQKKVRPP